MEREERDALIVELRGQGLSLSEVGDRVGLSGTRVSRILRAADGTGNGEATRRASTNGAASQRRHVCATPGCGKPLSAEHAIYSGHTGLRYCYPGEGCWLWSPAKRAKRRIAELGEKVEVSA